MAGKLAKWTLKKSGKIMGSGNFKKYNTTEKEVKTAIKTSFLIV
jgi:hypothetical protein